jgi:hypothetical protein
MQDLVNLEKPAVEDVLSMSDRIRAAHERNNSGKIDRLLKKMEKLFPKKQWLTFSLLTHTRIIVTFTRL